MARGIMGQLAALAIIGAIQPYIIDGEGAVRAHNERNKRYNESEALAEKIRQENRIRRAANFIKQKKARSQLPKATT